MFLETAESEQPGPWSLAVIKIKIFLDQCEFLGHWQKQVLIQEQVCILSAALMMLQVTPTPHTPSGTSTGAGDNETSQGR